MPRAQLWRFAGRLALLQPSARAVLFGLTPAAAESPARFRTRPMLQATAGANHGRCEGCYLVQCLGIRFQPTAGANHGRCRRRSPSQSAQGRFNLRPGRTPAAA